MSDDEKTNRAIWFTNIINNPEHRESALRQARHLQESGDPELHRADLVAGTSYLRKCMDNVAYEELKYRDDWEFVALWARGAAGAARWRVGKPGKPRQAPKPRKR